MSKVSNKNKPILCVNTPWLQDIIIISLVYCFVHGFMVVLSGTFHDDWLSYFHDTVTKNMEGFESGRPYYSMVIEVVWGLPGYGYRILSFITYWLSYLFVYGTFYSIEEINHRKAAQIALIMLSVPVNDARVLLANYPYALGMMLFFAAGFLLTRSLNRIKLLRIRLPILGLFFFSFTLNSNLVLYGIVILFLMSRFSIRRFYSYLDFILLPVLFFVLNHKLFPTYGAYEDYNLITPDKIKWTLTSMPDILATTSCSLLKEASKNSTIAWIAIIVTIGSLCLTHCLKDRALLKPCSEISGMENRTAADKTDAVLFLFGLAALIAGLFPYAVIRQSTTIAVVGIQGRDSMQIGLGIAMILVGGTNKLIREGLVIFVVTIAFFHFNIWYLQYQTEWYRQCAYQKKIVEIDDIHKGGNYFLNCVPDSEIGDRRFYTWSGNTAAATGKGNVFILNGYADLPLLNSPETMEMILSHYPMFKDYHADHSNIDGIIKYSADISLRKTVRMKFYELFNHERFETEINNIGVLDYWPINTRPD